MMTRALRFAALAIAATSLAGCVFVPALVPSDDSSTSPTKTATPRSPDVATARVALAAAVKRLTVVNEGSYTLWLTAKESGSSKRTYFTRTKTQYDLSRGMVASTIEVSGGTVKVRILESDGVYIKVASDGGPTPCWYRTSVKEFKSLPGIPFAYDLEKGSAFAKLMARGRAVSIRPDPDYPSLRIVRIRSSVLDVMRHAMPAVTGQFAYDVKGIKEKMNVDLYLSGSEVTAIDFDLVPVLDALDDAGLGDAADLPDLAEIRAGKPRGHLDLGDMKDSFKVEAPDSLCSPDAAAPDFSDA
ncbi:hypothetical protein [Aeromicrobium sp. 9AM]|uniref:hypothetical protein n=1 Tax=Aeromicrobium sp. 9AM TaxID=2653126 RepID=UPI0012F36291|nr:hypothetical protein [Aeromicrobium sp. 9AM]VXC29641.1 conserved exported hypothetical protein [Aeromicrobium sp. 9AM]